MCVCVHVCVSLTLFCSLLEISLYFWGSRQKESHLCLPVAYISVDLSNDAALFLHTNSTTFSPRQVNYQKKRQPILTELCFSYYQPLLLLCSQRPVQLKETLSKSKSWKRPYTLFIRFNLASICWVSYRICCFIQKRSTAFSSPNTCSFVRIDKKNLVLPIHTHTRAHTQGV